MRSALLVGLVAASTVCATEPWKLSLDANLTMTLNSYSENWAGTETGSLSWATQWTGIAEKQIGKAVNTRNTLKLAFGQTKTQIDDTRWSSPRKTTDVIDFESVWKGTVRGWVDPYIGARVVSQFLDARDPQLAHYGNPLDITESVGMMRDVLKKDAVQWNARLAGAVREHVDRIWEEQTYTDGGAELVTELNAAIRKDVVKLNSKLRLYEALFRDGSETIPNHWRHPDVDWENKLTINVTRFIMISYVAQLLYDREIDGNARFRQALAVGLSYAGKLPREKKE